MSEIIHVPPKPKPIEGDVISGWKISPNPMDLADELRKIASLLDKGIVSGQISRFDLMQKNMTIVLDIWWNR